MKIIRSSKIAFIHEERQFTYSDFVDNILSYSKLFTNKNKKVGILMENRPEWLFSFFGIWQASCAAVPMDYMSSKEDLEYVIKNSDSSLIICSNKTEGLIPKDVPRINVDKDKIKLEKSRKTVSFEKEDKLGAIVYTSGTSGKPVGVMLTKKNILSNVSSIIKAVKWEKYQSFYTFAPMFHSAGLMAICFLATSLQFKIILSDKISSEVIMNILQEHKIQIFGVIPRFAYMLHSKIMQKINSNFITRVMFKISRSIGNPKVSKIIFKKIYKKFGGALRYTACGGAALDKEVQKDLSAISLDLFMSYGSTEASPVISYSTDKSNKIGASGKVLPGVKVKIVDDEIVVKGDNISKGYYKNSKKTKEKFINGWFHTGDLGFIDEEGFLHVIGRKKEIIVLSNGKNIWPQKIEDKIEKASRIFEEVALFEDRGDLKLIVKPNEEFAKKEAISNINEYVKDKISDFNITLPDYQKIRDIIITSQPLPRTRIAKLKRFLLPAIAKGKINKESNKEHKMPGKEYYALEKFFMNNFNKQISPSSHIELDLGLDSLARIDFLNYIYDNFNVKMDIEDLAKKPVIKDIVNFISENASKVKELSTKITKQIIRTSKSNFSMKVINFLSRILMKIKIVNLQNIPDRPVVIVANHLSMLDWYAISASLGKKANKTLCLAKDKLIKKGFSKFIADRSNLIVFNVDRNVRDALDSIKNALDKGNNIVIFPEGTRSRDAEMLEFKKTFAIIAKEAKVDVIPTRIDGTFELLPPGQTLPSFGKVRIEFLQPISHELEIDEIVEKSFKSIKNAKKG